MSAIIKQAWKVNTQPLEDVAAFVGDLNSLAYDLFVQAAAEIEPEMMIELQTYPPVPPNSKYRRTYKLRDGWRIDIGQAGGDLFKFEVSNDTGYAVWVVGSLAQMQQAAARFQRDFHAAHGWKLASVTVTKWFNVLLDDYQTRFDEKLAGFGGFTLTRRARTSLR